MAVWWYVAIVFSAALFGASFLGFPIAIAFLVDCTPFAVVCEVLVVAVVFFIILGVSVVAGSVVCVVSLSPV